MPLRAMTASPVWEKDQQVTHTMISLPLRNTLHIYKYVYTYIYVCIYIYIGHAAARDDRPARLVKGSTG